MTKTFIACLVISLAPFTSFAQKVDAAKGEHAQIGIDDNPPAVYPHTTNPGAQWFPQAGLGLFIHWSISSVNEIDLSWPMMAGTQIGWRNPKLDSAEVRKIMASGGYATGHIPPRQYWALAKDFDPHSFDPDTWIRLAKEAGMTYAVLTTRHHDGFALWPSKYGDFNTKNYLGGRDFVKEFVAACRKYGLKVGLYYSGPDWHFNREFQDFMYYGVGRDYPDIPELDQDYHVRTVAKTEAEKQAQYEAVAAYVKGQVNELLTNYGKIDMIWFDGKPDIPVGNPAWKDCITMDQIRQLQPGIVVSPRFFGYGDYKTFESDRALPHNVQTGWAELCTTIATSGWGYTKAPLKSTAHILDELAVCRSNNVNMLLNFGPTKEGVFVPEMVTRFKELAAWMKVNGAAIKGTHALDATEQASVPAVESLKHIYLFVSPLAPETISLHTSKVVSRVRLMGSPQRLPYESAGGGISVGLPGDRRAALGNVIDVELK